MPAADRSGITGAPGALGENGGTYQLDEEVGRLGANVFAAL